MSFDYSLGESPKFQTIENFLHFLQIDFLSFQIVERNFNRDIGLDGDEEFGEPDLFLVFLNSLFDGTFQLVCILQEIVNGTKFLNEFCSSLFTHAWTTRNVVGSIAHESEQVDDLTGVLYTIFFAHFLLSQKLEILGFGVGLVHPHVRPHELPIILVGRHHENADFIGRKPPCQGTNYVVCLEFGNLNDRDVVGLENFLDDRYCEADALGRFFALCLVFRVDLVSKRTSFRVESHSNIVRILLFQHLFERVDEAHNGRSVFAFTVLDWSANKSIICSVNERVCVKKE